ncbi:MAG: winged helix-turn-helix transcriptional regulator [Dehalococcoidia bacterium]|nr:winged helix-turn-helix transcriptional regulator [Dehalococcoidia bacterium]
MRELVKVYKVLADESRLRVLNLVLERECCVCEVMQALGISQSKASRILSALYDAGFLRLRKDGLWSLYSIDQGGMSTHLKAILEATSKVFEGDKQMQIDIERLRTAKRVGPGCVDKACKATSVAEAARANS